MSLESWKKKYYPISACETDEADQVKHSLKKWKGLRAENLAEFGLSICGDGYVTDRYEILSISDRTCSLCYHHTSKCGDRDCDGCPYVKLFGETCFGINGPFAAWTYDQDPEPMIKNLKKLNKAVKEGKIKL